MSQVMEVGGVRLSYEVQGEGRPYVLICGGGQPAAAWHVSGMVGALVGEGYQVVTFDNRGTPPSDVPPPPYAVEDMAIDTIGLLEHLDRGPYIVHGASLGGAVAQTLALRRPDLVDAVVFHKGCGDGSAYAKALMRAWIDVMCTEGVPQSVHTALALAGAILPAQWADAEWVEGVAAIVAARGEVSTGLVGQYHAAVRWNEEEHVSELANLDIPALAIAGEYDCGYPPVLVRSAVARMPRGEFALIDGATHTSQDPSQSAQTWEAIAGFLARHASAR